MGGCAANNCSNHSRNRIRMFRFPTDPDRKFKWVENCGRNGWNPGPSAGLCIVSKNVNNNVLLLLSFLVSSKNYSGKKKIYIYMVI